MPKEPSSAHLRKGTKSCQECRQRKIRCIWPSEVSQTCSGCATRGRTCIAQVAATPMPDTVRLTSRDRIRTLEGEVASLWQIVRSLQGGEDQDQTTAIITQRASLSPGRDGTDSDTSDSSPANPPTHLQHLFDNRLLNSRSLGEGSTPDHGHAGNNAPRDLWHKVREHLLPLIPARESAVAISRYSLTWLSLYNALFSNFHMVKTPEEMLSQYDQLRDPQCHPSTIASVLLTLALTSMQIPQQGAQYRIPGIDNIGEFVAKVSSATERLIVSDDVLAGTLEGIETTMLYLRLTLAYADVKKVWIRLRRVIALAELNGLPRAAKLANSAASLPNSVTSPQMLAAKGLWESICTVERLSGVIWNLPISTVAPPASQNTTTAIDGNPSPQHYMNRLAEIAASVQELDDVSELASSDSDRLYKVLRIDESLRALAGTTSADWWNLPADRLGVEHLLQYWHYYFTIRAHLRFALDDDATHRYAYSHTTCLHACQMMATRYLALRPLLPSGFFACRVIDIETLTAGVFLLFNLATSNTVESPQQSVLADKLITSMEKASQRAGGDFAKKGSQTLRSLSVLLQGSGKQQSDAMTLHLPLLGKLQVSRKAPAPSTQQAQHNTQLQSLVNEPGCYQSQQNNAGSGSMEINPPALNPGWEMNLLEDFPGLPEDVMGDGQWLSSDFNGDFSWI